MTALESACCHCWPRVPYPEVCSSRAWERRLTVLMTLLEGRNRAFTSGGFLKELRCLVPAFHILPFTQRSQHRATGEQ